MLMLIGNDLMCHVSYLTAEFRQYFENFGRVVSAEVMFNRETHKSRGFGFVVFEDEASVDNVLQTTQHSIDGKMVSHGERDGMPSCMHEGIISHFNDCDDHRWKSSVHSHETRCKVRLPREPGVW